jgi:hypothetical protein
VSSETEASHGPLAANKRAGELVETTVGRRVPELGLVPDDVVEHYDAVATTLVEPSADLPFAGICLLERGTVVEIKSVMVAYSDGARGRFYFRTGQHEALVDDAGAYLFVVCEASPDREILAMKVVPATAVDDLLGDDPWLDGGAGRSDYAQLAWSNVFDVEEVSTGEP